MRNRFDPVGVWRSLLANSRLGRFAANKAGVSAVTFAISFSVLAPMTMGIFDIYQINGQRGKLQDALDAAALYAARSTATNTAEIDAIGDKALAANLKLIPGATLQSSNFVLNTDGDAKVVAAASVRVPALAPDAFVHNPVTVNTEVTRAGNDLEVAMVLDITGSMKGTPLTDLQSAANQLIDLVVSDTQAPYYSKVAIVPYSSSVNVGSYAASVRGVTQGGANSTTGANTTPPSTKFKFTSASGGTQTFTVSSCVSERTGAEAYTDASYKTALVGLVYPPGNENYCNMPAIQPLTSDKTALKNTITALTADGSTAGQIGLAWGWYMVSPNWADLVPTASQPAAYGKSHLIKAVVLMTDGAFNTGYCNGVIAKDSGSQSGSKSNHINCNATNGDAFTQAATLCYNMKHLPTPIIIYTVGFNVGSNPSANSLLTGCATDASHVYFPADGASLQTAFKQIAADLQRLRLSH